MMMKPNRGKAEGLWAVYEAAAHKTLYRRFEKPGAMLAEELLNGMTSRLKSTLRTESQPLMEDR